jgi:hypothetical protein
MAPCFKEGCIACKSLIKKNLKMACSGNALLYLVSLKYTDVSEVCTASFIRTMAVVCIALMMEAEHTSETSTYFTETTQRYIPEGCHLHTRQHENLKSHIKKSWLNIN